MRIRISITAIVVIALTTSSFAGLNRWTSSGPEGASITALAADPTNPRIAYAGTITGGVFRSTTDGEPDWQPFNTGLADLAVTALAVDRQVPVVVYAGTSQGRLFRSVNGEPWSEGSKPDTGLVRAFAVDSPRGTIYVATNQGGVLRSRDRGQTWELVPALIGSADNVVATGDGTLYVGMGSTQSVLVSRDGGETWTRTAGENTFAFTSDGEGTIFSRQGNTGIAESTDYGTTFRALPTMPRWAYGIFPRARGLYAATDIGLYAYDRGDAAWRKVDTISTRVNAMAPAPPDRLYAGTDGGIWTGTANGTDWRRTDHGLNLPIVLDVASVGSETAYAATEGGLYESRNGGADWRKLRDDSVEAVETDGANLIKAASDRGIHSSSDAGETWETVSPRITPALALSGSTPAVLYAGFSESFAKSTDGGRVWSTAATGLSYPYSWFYYGFGSLDIEVDTANPERAYVAWETGLFRTDDGGAQWTRLFGDDRENDPALAVAGRGTLIHVSRRAGITTSMDGGSTWLQPQLTNEQVFTIAIDPIDVARSYAGTASGRVYRTDDFGTSWILFSDGLGFAPIQRLATNDDGDRIYAGTSAGFYSYEYGPAFPIERLPDDPLRLPGLIRGLSSNVRNVSGAEPAAGASAAFVLPVAGSVRGFRGTVFRTDVTLSNDRRSEQSVIVAWLPQGNTNGASVPAFRLTLPAASGDSGGTLTVSDLASELGLKGLGSMIVFAVDGAGNAEPAASIYGFARVRSASICGVGSVSQAVSAVSSQAFGSRRRGRALGLRHDAGSRTNVGLVNLDEVAREFTILVDGEGASDRFTISVPPFAALQVPVPDRSYGGLALTVITSGNGPWAAYGSSVDNGTSDGWTSAVLTLRD